MQGSIAFGELGDEAEQGRLAAAVLAEDQVEAVVEAQLGAWADVAVFGGFLGA
jgi:hypothetical protein